MDLHCSYSPPWWLRSGHLQSIYATLCKPRYIQNYRRQRIVTEDKDFLDLDWAECEQNTTDLAILSHGLEGHTGRNYITGMSGTLNKSRIDCLAWNFRGCSGTPNRQLRLYHNGVYDDLHRVIQHAISIEENGQPKYTRISLVGFSMGGNLTLLYLGKMAALVPPQVVSAVTFSAPCDLAGAAVEIGKIQNTLYMKRFLRDLKEKVVAKEKNFPNQVSSKGYYKVKDFHDFDGRYTAPLHGFSSAEDYWQKCSSLPWLKDISIPTLLVNALDDPFLPASCYPYDQAQQNPYFSFLAPQYGGHVGFVEKNPEQEYWSEKICRDFIVKMIQNELSC